MFLGNKKNLFILVLLLAVFFTLVPHTIFAQNDVEFVPDPDPSLVTTPFDAMGSMVYRALTSIGGLVAWLGGTLLNISLSMFVFNLPATAEAFHLMDVVGYVWAFVRDLFNLLFIFGLTWIGFKFILGLDVNGAKRNLGTILIAALLINFSLYATQLIIDVGNVAAAEIGDLFTPAEGSQTQNVLGIEIIDISSSFIAATDISNIGSRTLSFSSYMSTGEETDTGSGEELGIGDALGMGLTITILLILIGFVFAAGAFLMFARFFYLIFLMMFSPIMFLGFVLPKMQNTTKNWWNKLVNQTLVGPAYIFMLLIALRALNTLMDSRGDGELDTLGFIMSSLLVAAFVWASLVVAKNFGAIGAAASMNFVGNGFAGGAAGLLRGTMGRGFQKISDSDRLRDAASKKGVRGWAARRTFKLSTKLGDTSFDARRVGGIGKRIGAGEGMKGGYKTATDTIAKKEKDFGDSLGKVSDDDPVVIGLQTEVDANDQAVKDTKKFIQEKRKALSETTDERVRQSIRADIESAKAKVEDLEDEKSTNTERLNTELYRRQVGSQINVSSGTKQEIKTQKDNIKAHLAEFASLQQELREADKMNDEVAKAKKKSEIEADKKLTQEHIAKTKKALAEAEKVSQKEAGGYAATVENKHWIANIFQGRDASQNQNAGKGIRKAYKDKVKSKDKGKEKDKSSDDAKDKAENKKE